MINLLRKILPPGVKKPVRNLIKFFKYTVRKHQIKAAVRKGAPLKIIVGAAETYQNGWYSTNEQWLDITNRVDWDAVFQNKPCLTHIVAEHVIEHLTPEEAANAFAHMRDYLLPGGRIRIAVPDGNNPDVDYIRHVGINGIGDDAADHKQLLSVQSLSALIESAGFEAAHIEGYDSAGTLIQNTHSPDDGFIMRSRANDNIKNSPWDFPDAGTSLIVDGIKRA